MMYELQAVIKPITKLHGTINVAITTPESAPGLAGYLIPAFSGVIGVALYQTNPHKLIDSEGYKLIDSEGYTLISSEGVE